MPEKRNLFLAHALASIAISFTNKLERQSGFKGMRKAADQQQQPRQGTVFQSYLGKPFKAGSRSWQRH
jgi:hypothetical protein